MATINVDKSYIDLKNIIKESLEKKQIFDKEIFEEGFKFLDVHVYNYPDTLNVLYKYLNNVNYYERMIHFPENAIQGRILEWISENECKVNLKDHTSKSLEFIRQNNQRWNNTDNIIELYQNMYITLKFNDMIINVIPINFHSTFARYYSWAIVPPNVILEIADFIGSDKCLSTGSGTGFIESLLENAGVDIIATDSHQEPVMKKYMNIHNIDGKTACEKFNDRTVLFTSWSRINLSKEEQFTKYVHIGENEGCTEGYPNDFIDYDYDSVDDINKNKWILQKSIDIPNWSGCRDFVALFINMH